MNATAIVQLACPECHSLNRVPRARLGDRPNCGRCKQPLFAGHPISLNAAAFQAHGVTSELPLLIDFWAAWCGPCRTMAPQFERAASQLEPTMRLGKLDTEAQPEIASRFAIRSIPTLLLLQRGRELGRQSGAMSSADIVRWARDTLG